MTETWLGFLHSLVGGLLSVNHGVRPLRVVWVDRNLAGIPALPGWGGAVRKPRGLTSEGGLGRPKLGWDSSAPWVGGAVRKPRGLTSEGGLGRPKLGWGTSTAWVGVLSVKKTAGC